MEPFLYPARNLHLLIRKLTVALASLPLLLTYSTPAQADSNAELWTKLKAGGYVLLLQHAMGLTANQQPSGVAPEACGAQDELSEQGQLEAKKLADALSLHKVSVDRVLACHDCRCIQTAGIVFGRAEPWSVIDDADDDTSTSAQKTEALREAVRRWSSSENLALISHRSNYQRAFGAQPGVADMGVADMLVIEPLGDGGFRLLGRLRPD